MKSKMNPINSFNKESNVKKNFLYIFIIVVTIMFVFPGQSQGTETVDCLKNVKLKVNSLKAYKSFNTKPKVLEITNSIVTSLKQCDFSESDIKIFEDFQKKIEIEVQKWKQSEGNLRTNWYAKEFMTRIRELENKYKQKTVGLPESPGGKPVTDTDQSPGKPGANDQKPKSAKGIKTMKDPENSILRTPLVTKKKVKDTRGLSVISASELKNKLEVVEEKLNYLSDTVRFYHYGFIFLIISAFVGLGLLILLIFILRNDLRKLMYARTRTLQEQKDSQISSEYFLKDKDKSRGSREVKKIKM